MEGYLIRIPRGEWLGDRRLAPSGRSRRLARKPTTQPAQLLYYELGEGFLRGYAAPGSDAAPVDEFQLTSFHVEVDPLYSMLMFEVFATQKQQPPGLVDPRAAGSQVVEKWCQRVLNWNRYVFGTSVSSADAAGRSADALEASRRELLDVFENHRHATWFSRSLVLKSTAPPIPIPAAPGSDASVLSTPPDVAKPNADAPPPTPWWTLTSTHTRRVRSTPARR